MRHSTVSDDNCDSAFLFQRRRRFSANDLNAIAIFAPHISWELVPVIPAFFLFLAVVLALGILLRVFKN